MRDNKGQFLKPTPLMDIYAQRKAKMGENVPQSEIAESFGIARETVYRWNNISGFKEWLEDRVAFYRTDIHERLETFANRNMDDFQYWKEMAKKYGYIIEGKDLDQKPLSDKNLNLSIEDIAKIVELSKPKKASDEPK